MPQHYNLEEDDLLMEPEGDALTQPVESQEPISSVMSASERALSGQIERYMSIPSFGSSSLNTASAAYAVMREEMEFRTNYGKVLDREQQIVFRDAAQKRMHKLAIENDRDALRARQALSQVPRMLEQGMSVNEAVSSLFRKDPGLLFNKFAKSGVESLKTMVMDEEQVQFQDLQRQFAIQDLTVKKLAAEEAEVLARKNLELLPSAIQALENGKEAALSKSQREVIEGNINLLKTQYEYTLGVENGAFLHQVHEKLTGERPFGLPESERERLYYGLFRNGIVLDDVEDKISGMTPTAVALMGDKRAFTEFARESNLTDKEGNPDSASISEILNGLNSKDAAAHGEAKKLVYMMGGYYQERYAAQILSKERSQELARQSEVVRKSHAEAVDVIDKTLLGVHEGDKGKRKAIEPTENDLQRSRQRAQQFIFNLLSGKGIATSWDFTKEEQEQFGMLGAEGKVENNPTAYFNMEPPAQKEGETTGDYAYRLKAWMNSAILYQGVSKEMAKQLLDHTPLDPPQKTPFKKTETKTEEKPAESSVPQADPNYDDAFDGVTEGEPLTDLTPIF